MDWKAWDAKVLEAETALGELWEMSKTLPDVTPEPPNHVTRKMVQDEINRAEFGLENAGVGASFFRE